MSNKKTMPPVSEAYAVTPLPNLDQPGSRAYFIGEPPKTAEPPTPANSVGMKYLTVASILIGIAVGVILIVGGLGRAFYVEKDAYTKDKIESIRNLNELSTSLSKVASSLDRLEMSVSQVSKDVKEMRERRSK